MDEGRIREDLPLVRWAVRDALYRAQQAIEGVLSNFPVKPLATLLRWLVFLVAVPLWAWTQVDKVRSIIIEGLGMHLSDHVIGGAFMRFETDHNRLVRDVMTPMPLVTAPVGVDPDTGKACALVNGLRFPTSVRVPTAFGSHGSEVYVTEASGRIVRIAL